MNENLSIVQKIVSFVISLNNFQRHMFWILIDSIIFAVAGCISYAIFFGIIVISYSYIIFFISLGFFFYLIFARLLSLNHKIQRYANLTDIFILVIISFLSLSLSGVFSSLVFTQLSLRFELVTSLIVSASVPSVRLLWQILYNNRHDQSMTSDARVDSINVGLIGAGDGGSIYMKSYNRNADKERIVAIIDEDPSKKGRIIDGVRVVGDLQKLPYLIKEYDIKKAIIAIPSLSPEKYEEILNQCNHYKLQVYNMPRVEDIVFGFNQKSQETRAINISDLLGRKEVELDESRLRSELEGKNILITGAGGSIGSEISRQIAKYNPAKIVLLGHGENSIYQIYHEHLKQQFTMTQFVPVIADVKDYDRIYHIFKDHKIDIVYHAAAHKHVPLMEYNPIEALTNNIIGTRRVAEAVDKAGVGKMVLISTDKAVRPPNIMGASKRIAELIVTTMNRKSKSQFALVRFGNVLGSRGSVVPAFQKMIAEGGPVQVTDFRMTRYFMTIPEAARLVIYAGSHSNEGEVFILDMDEPVKIVDLARKMILLSGHTEGDIEIVETGVRPGEKLYEEILASDELVEHQLTEKIYLGKVADVSMEEIDQFIEEMIKLEHNPRKLKEQIISYAHASLDKERT